MNMRDLAQWLIHIERLASDLYRGAARVFRDDERLSGFLNHLADEEEQHGTIMAAVADHLQKNEGLPPAFVLDELTRDKIEAPFLDCGSKMGSDSLRREHIIHCIVSAEFSEWNDLFVYVLNAVKDAGSEFAYTGRTMQTHRRHIELFIESLPDGAAYSAALRRLPAVWRPRILVVEDYEGVRDLLNAILSEQGVVETAANGSAALDKVQKQYYDVIVSDVDMPVMDGLRFFSAASKISPLIGERFLFLTGNPTDATLEFIGKNRLRSLEKPMQIHEVQRVVAELLDHEVKMAHKGNRGGESPA